MMLFHYILKEDRTNYIRRFYNAQSKDPGRNARELLFGCWLIIHCFSLIKPGTQLALKAACLPHARQKTTNIVGLVALSLAFFMGYE